MPHNEILNLKMLFACDILPLKYTAIIYITSTHQYLHSMWMWCVICTGRCRCSTLTVLVAAQGESSDTH